MTHGTQSSDHVSTKVRRIAELARNRPGEQLTTLSHHIDLDWMHEACRRTRKDGAVGVDRVTSEEYERELEGNLMSLLERIKKGTYRAPPVRRVNIPKGDGKSTRPIGVPTLEDKVAQRAIEMVLSAVFEEDFHESSYGFRRGRGAHDAVRKLRENVIEMKGAVIVELDITKFFDTLDRGILRELLSRRVNDGVIVRMVGKWLKAGVMEGGVVTRPEKGTPQGGVISPVLANIYLHEVLDDWFVRDVQPRMRGRASIVRYADDAVLAFEREDDAKRVLDVLGKRFAKYGLALHPDKTRIVSFRRPPPGGKPDETSGSFDFLGFTHHWAKSMKGYWVILRRTAKDRFRRALKAISLWLRHNRHRELKEQQKALSAKLRGLYGYYGIVGNGSQLWALMFRAVGLWKKWLTRRSQRGYVSWEKMLRILERYALPAPPRLILA